MPYHRTAVFKVHDPSGRKLRRTEKMQQLYSGTYSDILWGLKDCEDHTLSNLASAKSNVAADYFEWIIGGQPMQGAMWSGLVEDIQQSIDTYLDTPNANFPAPSGTSAKSVGELLDKLFGPIGRQEEEHLKAELKRKSDTYTRPINFARYRDNPIIRSDDGKKLWVAPHFQKRENDRTGALPPNGNSVRTDNWSYSTRSYHWKRQSHKETFPVECGQWHMHRFFRKGTPKSSKVHVVEGEIYVYYSFAFEAPNEGYEQGNPVMGIDRGEAVTAAYNVIGQDGSILEAGSSMSEGLRRKLTEIDKQIATTQERGEDPGELWSKRRNLVQDSLHRISNRIIETAGRYDAAIAFEDLQNLSGLEDPRMTRRQFSRLMEYVRYKAEEQGLWAEVEVHPAGTSTTCPECGVRDNENRQSREKFVCVNCQYNTHADLNAARIIGTRALWKINGGKDGTGCKTLTQYVKKLSRNRTSQTEAQRPN